MISVEVNSLVPEAEAVHAASEAVEGPAPSESGHVHQAPSPEENVSDGVKNF